ncbi:MAG: leucine-rich repeat domain-containing protein, partial [Clostridia bacterium]|nr:leucine-rich repeat domain-containing protein [Clostridia bacterium]
YIEDGELFLVLSTGEYVNCGQVAGSDGGNGSDGVDGVSITGIRYNDDGDLVITLSNGDERIVAIAPKGCDHVYGDWVVETEADCVTQGYKYHVCKDCGFIEHEITPALGHDYDHNHSEVLVTPATCTDMGWEVVTCKTCGETQVSKIEPTDHHYLLAEVGGYVALVCSDCGMHQPSEGLEFKMTYGSSGIEYTLTGLGTCTDEHLVVPDVIDTVYGRLPVTGIAKDVFNGSDIKSLYLSKNITKIEGSSSGMFAYCNGLSVINIHQKNPVYRSDGNCIVDIFNRTVIAGCLSSAIPSDGSVTTIGTFAFYGMTELTKLVIPEKVVTLETGAFGRCTGLTELNLGGENSMLATIGTEAFFMCTGLQKVTITNVPSIGQSAFDSCYNLKELILDKGCQRVRSYAFAACTSLETVRISSSVTRIDSFAFGACGQLYDLYYQGSTSGWIEIADASWNTSPNFYPSFTKTPISNSDIHYGQF